MTAFWTRIEQGLPEQPGWYIGLCGDTPETLRFDGSGWHHTRITRDLAQPRAWAAYDALPALNDAPEQPEALCGAQTMATSAPLSTWGFKPRHMRHSYCAECARIAGISVEAAR